LKSEEQTENIDEPVEVIEIDNDPIEEGSIEDVALNSAETPDTGPETTVLIILTLIVNTIFIFRKKIINK
jgi:hypothetical protein